MHLSSPNAGNLVCWETGIQTAAQIALFRLDLQMLRAPGSEQARCVPGSSVVAAGDETGLPEQPELTVPAKTVPRQSLAFNHTFCSPCPDWVLLDMQECCGSFTGMIISARLDRACCLTRTFQTG